MRLLLIGDVHLADKPPSVRTESYADDILAKLHWCSQYANDDNIDAVIQLGDVFHSKSPSRTSHALVVRAAEAFQAFRGTTWIVPGNHDLCLSDDSEALTDHGWRTLYQLDGTERFATLNPVTHQMEWQAPIQINRSHRTGEMLSFQSQVVDHVVTPNHALYVNVGSSEKHLGRGWLKKKAGDHPDYRAWRCWTTAPGGWQGDTPETVEIPAVGKHPGFFIPSSLAARLFGWYVSEGSTAEGVSSGGTRTTISQSEAESPAEWGEIRQLLDDLGLPYVERRDRKAFRINSKPLTSFLSQHFGPRGSEIRIPDWLMTWNQSELEEFLMAYFRGDGTSNTPGKTVTEAACVVARTCSQRLADGMQALCAQIGWTVNIGGWRDFPYGGTDYVGKALTYSFKRRQTAGLPVPLSVPYDGEVWCPTLSNGIWMARRNGKAIWTGNSADRLDSIDSQPLGALTLSPRIELATGYLPELNVTAIPYLDDLDEFVMAVQASTDAAITNPPLLVVTHQAIFPPGKTPPYKHVTADQIMVESGVPLAYAHIHDPHGAYQVTTASGTSWFCNFGAISRGSLHEETLRRHPRVAVFDSEADDPASGPFTAVDVPHRPADEVFRLDEVRSEKDAEERLDEFLARVGEVNLTSLSIEAVLADAETKLSPSAMAELRDILQEVQ